MGGRCINIDWLEVFCEESPVNFPVDAHFFRDRGYKVRQRDYGTPQYAEMFTIFDNADFPVLEIRRNPYSKKENGGIFNKNDCHIRLSNRECYNRDPIGNLIRFLLSYGYTFKNITRIDLALDFHTFDNGQDPSDFLSGYMADRYYKIGLSRVHCYGHLKEENPIMSVHGRETLYGKSFNSVKWGSPSSSVSVKLYDKSLELRETKEKFYIRDQWNAAGLNDTEQHVWRVEFSLKSDMKNFVRHDDGTLLYSSLSTYADRSKCLFMFFVLANRYFRFTEATVNRTGRKQRKDRCPSYDLFVYSKEEHAYTPVVLTEDREPTRTDRMLINRIDKYMKEPDTVFPRHLKRAFAEIRPWFEEHARMKERAFKIEDVFELTGEVRPLLKAEIARLDSAARDHLIEVYRLRLARLLGEEDVLPFSRDTPIAPF